MTRISRLVDRVKVVATSAVTYLTLAAAAIPFIASTIADQVPEHAEAIVTWGASVAGWLGAAVLIIRRVFTAPPEARGLTLPEPSPAVERIVGDLGADFASYAAAYSVDDVTNAFLVWRDQRAA